MRHKFCFLACLCSMLLAVISCEKSDAIDTNGKVYGVVTDKTTGEPIAIAGVELQPASLKTVTGSDGSFEFAGIESGSYRLNVTKAGYKDYSSDEITVSSDSKNKSHSIQLEKLPPAVTVVDDNQNEISIIDFGSNEGITMRSFNLFNNSTVTLDWSISYECSWIKSFSVQSGTLNSNATQSVVITIDRTLLNDGENSTIVNITSNNGSRQLTVKVTKTPTGGGTSYYIKHPWEFGDWTWKKMSLSTDGKEYTCTGYWSCAGANVNTSPSDDEALWFPKEAILSELEYNDYNFNGANAIFHFNPIEKTLSVTYQNQ